MHFGKYNSNLYFKLQLCEGFGPRAIFITSFSQNVRFIEKMCRTLLSSEKGIIVKGAYGGDAVEKMKVWCTAYSLRTTLF